MLDQIEQLMEAVKTEEQNVRRYELRAQLKLTPISFIIPWIRLSGWLSLMTASVLLGYKILFPVFPLGAQSGHEQIALKDEIDHVRQYLFIQKQR